MLNIRGKKGSLTAHCSDTRLGKRATSRCGKHVDLKSV